MRSIAGPSLDNSPVINMAIGFVKKVGAAKTVINVKNVYYYYKIYFH